MPSGIFWLYTNDNNEDRVLIGHPGAFTDTPEEAIADGRRVLETVGTDAKLRPAGVGQFSSLELGSITDDVTANCEEIYLGPDEDEIFYDVTDKRDWATKEGWPLKQA